LFPLDKPTYRFLTRKSAIDGNGFEFETTDTFVNVFFDRAQWNRSTIEISGGFGKGDDVFFSEGVAILIHFCILYELM
jgi:hypothetical protein